MAVDISDYEHLPEGWTSVSLAEIATLNPRHPSDLDDSLPITFAPMSVLSETGPELRGTSKRQLGEVRKGYTHFAEGDVLFAKITPCMENGKAAIARNLANQRGCGTTELHVVRPLGGILPEYIYHLLHQESVRHEAAAHFTGSAGQLRVPATFMQQLPVPLPPLAEQQRIVAKVETLLSRVRAVQDRLARVPLLLKRFRQAVLTAACNGQLTADWREEHIDVEPVMHLLDRISHERFALWCKSMHAKATAEGRTLSGDAWTNRYPAPAQVDLAEATELPDSWQWTSFDSVTAGFQYGPRFGENEYVASGVPTIRTTDMTQRGAIAFDSPPCVKISDASGEHFLLQDDDLLVTRTGATIGKCALYSKQLGPAIASAYLIRYRLTRTTCCPRFVLLFFLSPFGQAQLIGGTTAVAQPNVNTKTIAKLLFPVAPLAEQHELVRRVDTLFKLSDAIERRVAAATARADKITQAILAKAFRGELVPTEAELARAEGRDYETAEQLLERIRLNSTQQDRASARRMRQAAAIRPPERSVSVKQGRIVLDLLLLLDAWKKPVSIQTLEPALLLMRNDAARETLLVGQISQTTRQALVRPGQFIPGLDRIYQILLLNGALRRVGRSALQLAKPELLQKASDRDRAKASEAIRAIERRATLSCLVADIAEVAHERYEIEAAV